MRYRVNSPAVIAETIDGEALIVNLESGCYYSLAGSGEAIWSLVSEGTTSAEAAKAVAAAYGVEHGALIVDVERFVAELVEEALLVEDASAGPAASALTADGTWAPPRLEKYTDMQQLLILDPIHDVEETGWPHARPDLAGHR